MPKAHDTRRTNERRSWARQKAIEALVRSASALTDVPSEENLALAFLWAGIAMIRVSEADADGQPGLEKVIELLEKMKAEKSKEPC